MATHQDANTANLSEVLQELAKALKGMDGAIESLKRLADTSKSKDVLPESDKDRVVLITNVMRSLSDDLKMAAAVADLQKISASLFESQKDKPPSDYIASDEVAEFVARGLRASDEVALRAVRPNIPVLFKGARKEISAEELKKQIAATFTRLLRATASEVRSSKRSERVISEGSSWATDLQYEIADQFPVRPDDTTPFLHVLLSDVAAAVGKEKRLGGDWGRVAFDGNDKLVMRLNPTWRASVPPRSRRETEFTIIP